VTATAGLPPPVRGVAEGRPRRPPVDPRLLRLDPRVGRLLLLEAGVAVVSAAALIAQATALAAIIARTFLGQADLAELRPWLGVLLAAIVVRALVAWGADLLAQRTAAGVKSRLRAAVVARLLRRAPDGDDDLGGSVSLLTDGIDALDGTFGGYLPALVQGLVVPLVLLGWVLTRDLSSGLVLLVTLPLIPTFMVLIGLAAKAVTRRRFQALTDLSGQLLTVLEALPTIRLARASDRVGTTVRAAAERLRVTTLGTLRVAFVSALVLELLAALGVATVAVIAGVRLAGGSAELEPVLAALLLAPEAFWPLRRVGQQFHANEEGAAAADRLLAVLEDHPGQPPDPGVVGAGDRPGDAGSTPARGRDPAPDPAQVPVRLRRVTVTHPGRPLPALDRVDLTLPAGQRTVVVGASGAGKTTLAALVLGLRAPDAGTVRVGTVPLDGLAPDAWHARIAWVPQEPADLRGRIREVVTLGAPAHEPPSETAIGDALRAVGLDEELAALPDGLDTVIGPGARRLSAGQRRRLALARALLRPAGLLVLDEPTGDLDTRAERRLWAALERLRGERTVLVLTHRVGLARGADQVVVLGDGQVLEAGPPARLRAAGGPFAALVAAASPLRPTELTGLPPTLATPAPDADAAASETEEVGGRALVAATGAPVWRWPLQLLWPHRRAVGLAAAAGALAPLSGVVLVAVSTYLIAAAALRPNLLDLTVTIVAVRALSLSKGVSRYVERLAGHDAALHSVVDLRSLVYERLVPRVPAGLPQHRVGDLLARVVSDVDRLQLALVRGVVPALAGAIASVVIVLVGGWLLPTAVPVLLGGVLTAGLVVPWLAWRVAAEPQRRLADARGELAAELAEVLPAAPELALLGRLEAAGVRLGVLDAQLVRADRSAVARGGGADAAVQLALGATLLGLVVLGVPAVRAGTLDGVLLGSLLVLAVAATEAIGPLPAASQALTAAATAARRLREVLEAPLPTAAAPAATTSRVSPPVRLEVDRASAAYPPSSGPEAPVLHELTLTLEPGTRIAVVGRSGAGKSTLANLLVRFLDPTAGELRVGGAPYRTLAGDEVRRWVTAATQDAQVVEGTIASNLRLAAPEADDTLLDAVLRRAQLDRWVRALPDGLATPVGERGARLSGGQRHRLALARSLLVGASVLVLDEPTAGLDPVTGRAFLVDALRAGEGRGVVVLTHDLRVLPVVDEVLVVEAGRIVSRGSHRTLLATDEGYRARWDLEVAVGS
jgi:ATP-binding cassette, subfamily C, bacterial CydCD